jgi:uncharacterized membrane protein YGL010W
MKTLVDHLSQYAAYHQDARNVATHFVGIPMIVLALATLLARPALMLGEQPVSVATVLALGTIVFHLRLDLCFGLVMALLLSVSVWVGQVLAAQTTMVWLCAGLGLFVLGWVIQFIGHWYEGRKPAFVDDIVGLFVGPLFLAAEVAFALGWRREVEALVAQRLQRDAAAATPDLRSSSGSARP